MDSLKTPVAFIIFNRPDCTEKAFAEIRKARPEKLYLIADGARPHKPGEEEKCARTRDIVERMIDWPCEVHKNYSNVNLGCGQRIPTGLDWVFDQEERAIIIEDDILPDPTFFIFCTELLERYKDTPEIMQISGYNRSNYNPGTSYFYSRVCDFWGWATWRHAWRKFRELDSAKWNEIRAGDLLAPKCLSAKEVDIRTSILNDIFSGQLSAWGMRWELTKIMNNGLGVIPSHNLTKNIGFGLDASHTLNPFTKHRFIQVHKIAPPYTAPKERVSNVEFEQRYLSSLYPNALMEKLRTRLMYLLGKH